MKYILSLTLILCLALASCRKGHRETPQPPVPVEGTREIRLHLLGDIRVSESPLSGGRVAPGVSGLAKTVRDSTLYVVFVKTKNGFGYYSTYSSGLYDVTDSIRLQVPVTGDIRIVVNAFRRGTSIGLFHTWQNGLRKYNHPFNAVVNNKSDTLHRNYPGITEDTISWVRVFNPLDTLQELPGASDPEVDAFQGTVDFQAATAPSFLVLNMRRAAYGIRFASTNFISGKLIAEFLEPGHAFTNLQPHSVTPADIGTQFFIHSSDLLKTMDSLPYGQYVQVKWQKPDGSFVPVGSTFIRFKRNVMTTINITIPNSGRVGVSPNITETDWSGTESVNL